MVKVSYSTHGISVYAILHLLFVLTRLDYGRAEENSTISGPEGPCSQGNPEIQGKLFILAIVHICTYVYKLLKLAR